jgi:salicylate hydroxylase
MGLRVTGYVREQGGASIYVDGAKHAFGHLVVAADGVHSALRQQMTGDDRARFQGQVAWRCLVPATSLEEFELPSGTTIWASDDAHALTTRIRGGDVVNFVGVTQERDWQEEGWHLTGDRAQALEHFGAFNPLIPAILERTQVLHRWALLGRPPLAKWRDGPVVLVGDAAHPMLPSMAQGAVMALEDAVVLGRLAAPEADLKDALRSFERTRKPRTTRIQARSAQNMHLYHKKGALRKLGFFGPLGLAARLAPGVIHGAQDWIYKFDPTA